jgi:hypothetical protein
MLDYWLKYIEQIQDGQTMLSVRKQKGTASRLSNTGGGKKKGGYSAKYVIY